MRKNVHSDQGSKEISANILLIQTFFKGNDFGFIKCVRVQFHLKITHTPPVEMTLWLLFKLPSLVCSNAWAVFVCVRIEPFQPAITNESPAPASMGVYNYIMIWNRLCAVWRIRRCQLTPSLSIKSLMHGSDLMIASRAEESLDVVRFKDKRRFFFVIEKWLGIFIVCIYAQNMDFLLLFLTVLSNCKNTRKMLCQMFYPHSSWIGHVFFILLPWKQSSAYFSTCLRKHLFFTSILQH